MLHFVDRCLADRRQGVEGVLDRRLPRVARAEGLEPVRGDDETVERVMRALSDRLGPAETLVPGQKASELVQVSFVISLCGQLSPVWQTSLPSMNSTTAAVPSRSQTKKCIGIGMA
jgi:hypothetical protein